MHCIWGFSYQKCDTISSSRPLASGEKDIHILYNLSSLKGLWDNKVLNKRLLISTACFSGFLDRLHLNLTGSCAHIHYLAQLKKRPHISASRISASPISALRQGSVLDAVTRNLCPTLHLIRTNCMLKNLTFALQ